MGMGLKEAWGDTAGEGEVEGDRPPHPIRRKTRTRTEKLS